LAWHFAQFFDVLETYDIQGAGLAAYSRGESDKENEKGIVKGHAYSILDVRKAGGLRFVQLRNPVSGCSRNYAGHLALPFVCEERFMDGRRSYLVAT